MFKKKIITNQVNKIKHITLIKTFNFQLRILITML